MQGCNPFALWGKMTPTANLEPAILAVGCELELALKGPYFFACREEQNQILYRVFRVSLLVARSKEFFYKGFRASANLFYGLIRFNDV